MSALGDYIHLKVDNYNKYGVMKKGGQKAKLTLEQVYKAQKAINQNRINSLPDVNQSILNTLNERISKNFPEGKDKGRESLDKALAENKLSERIKNFLLTEINGNLIKQSNIDNSNIEQMTTNNALVKIEEARRLRNNLYQNIETLNRRFKEGKTAGTTPTTIVNNLNDFFNALGMALPNNEWIVHPNDIKNIDTLTALKEILHSISFAEANNATLHGQMGEQTVRMCGDVAVSKGLEAINGVIVGSHPTKFQLNEKIIPKKVGETFKKDTGLNLYQVRSSQDKVDVQIVVNKQPLNTSVKAYTARGNSIRAHLQDVSLLTSLATTVTDFANHWLNIHTLHLNNHELDSALIEHIKYEALVSGNLLKKGALLADTFIAIDVTSGRVYSASTKDILNGNGSSTFYLTPDIYSLHISGNQWQDTWEKRISNILQSVHSKKISVALNVSLQSKNLTT